MRKSEPATGKSTRLLLVLLLTLAAFAWHSLVTQTHLHLAPSETTSSFSGAGHGAHDSNLLLQDGALDDCLLCQELALSGDYIPPAPIDFIAPTALAMLALAVAIPHPVRRRRSHIWRSRAPPRRHGR